MDAATAGDTAGTGSAAATAGTAALSATTTENLRRRATVYLNWARKALQEDKERTRKMFNHRLYEEMQSLNYQESQQSRLVKDGNDHVRDENVVLQQEPKSAPSAGASSAAARTLLEEEGADEVDEPRPNKTESAVKNVCSKQDKEGAGNYSNTDDATSLSTTTRARRKDMCSTSDGASGTTFEKITIPKVKKKKELSFYADKPDVKMNQLSDEDIDRLIKEELEEIRSRTFFQQCCGCRRRRS
ncbi:unnamed protein product [Amoebophrya sp. A120]|nr:unnamed protein product [Amoebophrya sp. A120]|eukprot:GSA120T00010578001.1